MTYELPTLGTHGVPKVGTYSDQSKVWTYIYFIFTIFYIAFQMELVERKPRVCKAVIKAKGGYFEESQIDNIFCFV